MIGALRLVAVYVGTGGAALWLAHRFVKPVSRRAAAALLLLPLLPTGRALLTGRSYGPMNLSAATAPLAAQAPPKLRAPYADGILSDLAFQIVPWQKAVRNAVKHGRLPLLNPYILSGDILLAASQPAVFHPGTILGFLLPLATARTFQAALTFLLCALFMFLYLRELDVSEPAALFGGAAWMLSGFFLFWVGWPLAAAFAPLPLLLLGLRRIARGERGGFGCSAAALALSASAGHPETLAHLIAAGGFIFLFDLARCRRRLRAAGLAVAAGLLAAAIAAPAILPALEEGSQTMEFAFRSQYWSKQKKSLPLRESLSLPARALVPRPFDTFSRSGPRAEAGADVSTAFVGGGVLALAALGLGSRRKEKWALAALAILCIAVAARIPAVTDAVSRLPLLDVSLNGRLAGAAAFGLAALAALGLDRLAGLGRGRAAAELFAAAAVLGGIGLASGLARPGAALFLFAPGAAAAAAASVSAPRVRLAAAFTAAVGFHLAETPRLYPAFRAGLFYPPVPELGALPRGGEPYRVAALGFDLVPNQSALWELEDPRGYESLNNARYLTTYPLWCVPQGVWFNRIDDASRPFLAALNVRFLVGGPQSPVPAGWTEWTRGPNCAIFENPSALPRAFVPERIVYVGSPLRTVQDMEARPDFARVGWIEDPAESGEVGNGPAAVNTRRRGTDLLLDIDAQAPTWIIVSQTAWKGWRAFEGRREIALHFADQALLGFHVSAGRHVVRLTYRPRSVPVSFAISAAAVLLLAGVSVSRSRISRSSIRTADP